MTNLYMLCMPVMIDRYHLHAHITKISITVIFKKSSGFDLIKSIYIGMKYLIEPYNAHQKPPRKKHWTELAEEESLFIKTMIEQNNRIKSEQDTRNQFIRQCMVDDAIRKNNVIMEANISKNIENISFNQNIALPQYSPQPPSQQVQDGQYASPAGGGGYVPLEEEYIEVANFSLSPSSGTGPLLVSFTNLTPTPDNDTFLWNFGSGSLTSTSEYPSPVTYTATGSYVVILQSTSSTGNATTATNTVTVLPPSLISLFTISTSPTNANHYFTASFTGSVSYNGAGTLSGLWSFGDATTMNYINNTPFTHVYPTGSYTASLSVTESLYKITSTSPNTYISQS